jgi:hypothetical protein
MLQEETIVMNWLNSKRIAYDFQSEELGIRDYLGVRGSFIVSNIVLIFEPSEQESKIIEDKGMLVQALDRDNPLKGLADEK